MTRKTLWDRYAIVAEVQRRGATLKRLSQEAGEPDCTAAQALRQGYPKGEKIISDFLGIPVAELWPDRYPEHSIRRKTNAANTTKASQKSRPSAGVGEAA
jgi:Ner family transcriptional regulator